MNIALNSACIAAPIKALWHWLMATPGQTPHKPADMGESVMSVTVHADPIRIQVVRAQPHTSKHTGINHPLRVLRVFEAGQTPAQVGRMRISGRMADVCAELDRLAAHESLLH